jgi:hypothetical protein
VRDFSEDGGGNDALLAIDRAEAARLDYLALGDWHGQMRLGPRTAYAGTPEQDSFRHAGPGACLLITLTAPGDAPRIDRIETGQLEWHDLAPDLVPGQDPAALVLAALPADPAARRNHLVRLRPQGRARLAEHAALEALAAEVGPQFCHFVLDCGALAIEPDAADLDRIDRSGALRVAADRLAEAAADPARAASDRAVAAGALNRLYGYLQEGAQ